MTAGGRIVIGASLLATIISKINFLLHSVTYRLGRISDVQCLKIALPLIQIPRVLLLLLGHLSVTSELVQFLVYFTIVGLDLV